MITITYDDFENCIYIQIITITDYTYPSSDGYIPNMLWSDDFSWSYGPLVIWGARQFVERHFVECDN